MFHFFRLKYCPKSFLQDCRVSRYFTKANSRKGSKQVENRKKLVIFTIFRCHGNSLHYTHMNEKEIPGVWLIFTVNARSLNPKRKQIDHFQFFILLQEYLLLILQGASLRRLERVFGCYSVCGTMKDTKEGYFKVQANYIYLCNSVVG